MSPARLALRTILLGHSRNVLAILLLAGSLCVLDLFAGHVASARARMEYQAVIGERIGHLAILREAAQDDASSPMFSPEEALRVIRIAERQPGVAMVVPQMSVSGIASTGARSALFFGEGVVPSLDRAPVGAQLPGKLNPAKRNGIAVSKGQARSLGLRNGSSVTLTGATVDARSVPMAAEIVDVYSMPGLSDSGRQPLIMPFSLAQTLLDTERTERVVVYLADGTRTEEKRQALTAALASAGVPALVKTWQDLSVAFASERGAADIAFDSVAGMVFAVIAATVAATISMNTLERRREVGVLRALGMSSSGVFLMFVMEAVWMALMAVVLSLVASSLIAWIVNRAALSYTAHNALSSAPMLVELDFNRMAMAVVTVLAVALMASLVPAFKAARGAVAPALAA